MCFPIQYAVTWPDRVPNRLPPLDFAKLAQLEFEAPRREDFPALDLARWAGETGGTLPAVLNAANEVAVAAFLEPALLVSRDLADRGAGDARAQLRCTARPWMLSSKPIVGASGGELLG